MQMVSHTSFPTFTILDYCSLIASHVCAIGVYDMFHFGYVISGLSWLWIMELTISGLFISNPPSHALQLRQAKLSLPSVHLLVGVPSDELCTANKARTVLSHFERLESVRHCRWADEVVPDAPWILDEAFLEKHNIDYVAHDEEPYAGPGGDGDIYQFVKDLGMSFVLPCLLLVFLSLSLTNRNHLHLLNLR